jgi:hypothetical protein
MNLKNTLKSSLLLLSLFFIISCGNSNSSKSSGKKCDDMESYNLGKKEGQNNRMYTDCDYYWKMDKQWVKDKKCFCKGFKDYNKY